MLASLITVHALRQKSPASYFPNIPDASTSMMSASTLRVKMRVWPKRMVSIMYSISSARFWRLQFFNHVLTAGLPALWSIIAKRMSLPPYFLYLFKSSSLNQRAPSDILRPGSRRYCSLESSPLFFNSFHRLSKARKVRGMNWKSPRALLLESADGWNMLSRRITAYSNCGGIFRVPAS